MENLNYCRQMKKQFMELLVDKRYRIPEHLVLRLKTAIVLADTAQKFMLPENGRLYDDPEYKAIDETEPLKLPYPIIALEYSRSGEIDTSIHQMCSKAIVFVGQHFQGLRIMPIAWIDKERHWSPLPDAFIPNEDYMIRNGPGKRAALRASTNGDLPLSDFHDEIGALMCFLNVLRCGNVHTQKVEARKCKKGNRKALPFDEYHILTIDINKVPGISLDAGGTHRSPREHLRRGHIRRLADNRRIWVNASVVCAGRGFGKVDKDYEMKE